ncbi:MAG: hypothetical protein IPL99_01285 [Candidatus Competibacteraceae bacterium]|nr:hypothetical protein [Candidatus Competibacteraceae bacterium]
MQNGDVAETLVISSTTVGLTISALPAVPIIKTAKQKPTKLETRTFFILTPIIQAIASVRKFLLK